MPRSYYLAVEPPPLDRARLSLVMRRFGNPSPLPHITVVEPPRLPSDLSWWDSVTEVGIQSDSVEIELHGVRTFDDRVLYLSVHAPSLGALRRRLLTAANDVIVSDDHPFVPHLTLVVAHRGRSLPDPKKIEPLVAHLKTFRASELTLFRRDIAAHEYRAWRRVALGAS